MVRVTLVVVVLGVAVLLCMVPKSNRLFVYGWHEVGVRCAGL